MKITDIVKAKGERYTIFVDDEYWYIINLEIIMFNHVKIDMEVDEDFLYDLKRQAMRRTARERAYYLLGYRDHSKKELYDKLLKSAESEIALEIVEMVEEQGLINDEEYAGKLARYYLESKKWGRKKAYMEMLRRGISRELANSALAECDTDFDSTIKAIVDKKYYDKIGDYKGKQKVIAALLRMGFDYSDIKSALLSYSQDE